MLHKPTELWLTHINSMQQHLKGRSLHVQHATQRRGGQRGRERERERKIKLNIKNDTTLKKRNLKPSQREIKVYIMQEQKHDVMNIHYNLNKNSFKTNIRMKWYKTQRKRMRAQQRYFVPTCILTRMWLVNLSQVTLECLFSLSVLYEYVVQPTKLYL